MGKTLRKALAGCHKNLVLPHHSLEDRQDRRTALFP